MTNTEAPAPYTTAEATDMAVMLLIRKLRKIDGGTALGQVLAKLDALIPGATEALAHAEQRGDSVRFADEAQGREFGTRTWPTRFVTDDDEQDD